MAITRTPIVDDDGTGTTGTVLNNSWKQELYNQIDAVAVGSGGSAVYNGGAGVVTVAAGVSTLQLQVVSGTVLTGFSVTGGNQAGQCLIVHNIGAPCRIAYEDASATAAFRVYSVSTRGQWIGTAGGVLLYYDGPASRWRMTLINAGLPITVAHNAALFSASVGTWTVEAGDQAINQFIQEGAMLTWFMRVVTTSVSNAGVSLTATLPGGFSCATGHSFLPVWVQDAGASPQWGIAAISFGTTISFYAAVGVGGFAVSTNATEINMVLRFQIQ